MQFHLNETASYFLSLLRKGDLAFCFGIIEDDLLCIRSSDRALIGILDAVDDGGDGGFYLRTLERQIGVDHFTVDELEIFAIAEGLRSNDLAVDQGQVVGVLSQIFALDGAVLDRYVFGVPKGILGVQLAVFNRHVRDVLEGVFAAEF